MMVVGTPMAAASGTAYAAKKKKINIPPKDARDRINRCATERGVHENLRRIKYDATHGPPGLRQFSSHLRQVVWPHNFKLEKLKKYDGKENP